jgi:uncharacterized protein (TIGR03083 family)
VKIAPRYDTPPLISIDGPWDDQLEPVSRQRRRLESFLAGLSEAEWARPSRCDGWTVQDVVAHIVGVNAFWRASVLAGLAGTPTRILTGFDPVATPALMVDSMRALTPTEVLDQFAQSNDAFLGPLGSLDEPGWSMPAEAPPGHIPVRLLAQHALWDCWIHERDIALALGSVPAVERDEVLSCLRYAAALSPGFSIMNGDALTGVFAVDAKDPDISFVLEVGESVAVRAGAAPGDALCLSGNAVELVEALSIRGPLPTTAPAEWRRLLGGLATAFDSAV